MRKQKVREVIDLLRVLRSFRSDQIRSVAQLCQTLCDPMNCSTPGHPVYHQLPEFTETHVHRVSKPSSHLILCRPLLLLPPIPPSIRVFSNEWIQTRAIWNKSLCLNYATLSLKVKIKIQYIRPNWRMSAKLDHPMGIQTARSTGQTEGMEWRLLEWRGRASGFSSKLSAWVRKAEA